MRVVRVIIGAILLFVGIGLFFGFLLFGLTFLIFGFLFLGNKFNAFSILNAFWGTIAILGGITAAPYGFTVSNFSIVGTIITLLVGLLAVLPLKFYKKSFVRDISYLFSVIIIFWFLSACLFFFKLSPSDKFAGDFSVIPMYILGSLLLGILCIPFLIAKSVLARKS